jgi:putative transposase
MPRRARLEIAGASQLVLQSSPDHLPMFFRTRDYRRYLDDLRASSVRCECEVHAYALLPLAASLLVTGSKSGAVARMMQSLGRRYARYANARDGLQGARWQGRYRSCPVGGAEHVLRAAQYVELSPVRAGLVSSPGAYRWSSYAAVVSGTHDPVLTPHAALLALSGKSFVRRARYRRLMEESPRDDVTLRLHLEQGRAWGCEEFLREVAAKYGECRPAKSRGRPRKHGPTTGL